MVVISDVKMSLLTRSKCCDCIFPNITYPGKCTKCSLSHKDAELMVHRAIEIPWRMFAAGEITWMEYESIQQSIDRLVWKIYNNIHQIMLGEMNLFCFFQEQILLEVKAMMTNKYNLFLTKEDEAMFSIYDVSEKFLQLQIVD